jgi:hypothetical protein
MATKGVGMKAMAPTTTLRHGDGLGVCWAGRVLGWVCAGLGVCCVGLGDGQPV